MKIIAFLTLLIIPTLQVGPLGAKEYPVEPYVDPSQLVCPGPKHSFYKQPWRGFLETRPATTLLDAIGINYNVHRNDDLAVRLLAESGFKDFRIEIGWADVAWDESHLNDDKRIHHLLELCSQYHIRPTLLLNANHGAPCPVKFFEKRLAQDAAKGERSVKFTDNSGIVVGYTGVSQLTGYWAAEAIITAIDPKTGECQLSKPLPKALSSDKPVHLATLKYLPLFPVGTPQFDQTAAGWTRYALLVCDEASRARIDDFDLEIWNELSFGSNFTDARHYFNPPPFPKPANFLLPGGSAWELARRTVQAVKKVHPRARIIWGFSNTTFFHCPIAKLPAGIDGQSYHPYGTGTRSFPKNEDLPQFNLEGYTPTIDMRMPEGWAQDFTKTECLMKLLNPRARQAHPPDTTHFHHYMTEHGVAPPECGVNDAAGAWALKTQCALRSYCLWVNKGIDQLDYFCAWDKTALGMGLLPPDLATLPTDAKWDDVATSPMKAVRNLTRAFAGAEPLRKTDPLGVKVSLLGEPRMIFSGDATHPPLWQRQAFAVLPFQVNARTFIIAYYAMTYDATAPYARQKYRLTITGLPGAMDAVSAYDPVTDSGAKVSTTTAGDDGVSVELMAADYPCLLKIVRR